jgi:hypothetical protein
VANAGVDLDRVWCFFLKGTDRLHTRCSETAAEQVCQRSGVFLVRKTVYLWTICSSRALGVSMRPWRHLNLVVVLPYVQWRLYNITPKAHIEAQTSCPCCGVLAIRHKGPRAAHLACMQVVDMYAGR